MKQAEIMGILNITPDSFFADSRKQTEREIAERTNQIILEGGTMIDVGAFSTRPGAAQVSEAEEMRRMRYGLEIVRREQPDAILSIDTFRPSVARMAVEEYGATIINDVSEGGVTGVVDTPLESDGGDIPEIFREVAHLGVRYVLMSVQPTFELTVSHFLHKIKMLHSLGHHDIILDPGYGFGKDVIAGNYSLLSRQQELKDIFRLPLLVGVSRKRMIRQLIGGSPADALNGTTAVHVLALERGADILRVHDVRAAVEAVKIVGEMISDSLRT